MCGGRFLCPQKAKQQYLHKITETDLIVIRNLADCTTGFIKARRLPASPVIIGGCERSGTTLLHASISAHPRIHAINDETWAFCYGPQAGFSGNQPIRKARLYKHLGMEKIQPEAIRWCENSLANIFYSPIIHEHFASHVRMIQIVRDERDVVTSQHPRKPN